MYRIANFYLRVRYLIGSGIGDLGNLLRLGRVLLNPGRHVGQVVVDGGTGYYRGRGGQEGAGEDSVPELSGLLALRNSLDYAVHQVRAVVKVERFNGAEVPDDARRLLVVRALYLRYLPVKDILYGGAVLCFYARFYGVQNGVHVDVDWVGLGWGGVGVGG